MLSCYRGSLLCFCCLTLSKLTRFSFHDSQVFFGAVLGVKACEISDRFLDRFGDQFGTPQEPNIEPRRLPRRSRGQVPAGRGSGSPF